MLTFVNSADAMRRFGAILGIVVAVMLVPSVFVSAWAGVSVWQQTALVAIGSAFGIYGNRDRESTARAGTKLPIGSRIGLVANAFAAD
jgi:hypothetical protein